MADKASKARKWNYIYILRCADDTLYTGWTNNLPGRLDMHNAGKGAKYTKSRLPVELVYWEAFDSKQEAMKREHRIKHFPREKKLKLISNTVHAPAVITTGEPQSPGDRQGYPGSSPG